MTWFRSTFGRFTIVSSVLIGLSSCGSDVKPDPDTNPNTSSDLSGNSSSDMGSDPSTGGPRIISFGTNVSELTEGEFVRFVAVLTDPGGLDKLVGGQLTSPDGKIKYGAFVASQQGSYALDLPWAQLSQAQQINFATEENRTFVGEFFNLAGQKTSMPIVVRLHCKGEPACEGRCTPTGNRCATSTDKLCIAGACKSGCYIGGAFSAADQISTVNTCQVCKPMVSTTVLQSRPDFSSCMPGLTCGATKCEVPFTRQDTKATNNTYGLAAASAMVQIVVGNAGTIVRTADGGTTWNAVNSNVTNDLSSAVAVSANDIYVAGTNGTILKSADAGVTWSKLVTGSTAQLKAMWASSAADVWAVGNNGSVVRSITGGANWTKHIDPDANSLQAIWGSSATNVYIVSERGIVLRTTNSGTTYTSLYIGAPYDLNGVWGSSAADVYVVGAGASVLRSTNNGTSWTRLTAPPAGSTPLYGVWGSAANNVYVVGSFGQVWRTTDSQTLTAVPLGSVQNDWRAISGTAANEFSIMALGSPNLLRKL